MMALNRNHYGTFSKLPLWEAAEWKYSTCLKILKFLLRGMQLREVQLFFGGGEGSVFIFKIFWFSLGKLKIVY